MEARVETNTETVGTRFREKGVGSRDTALGIQDLGI